MNINIIKSFYSIFLKDSHRIYRLLPINYRVKIITIFFIQLLSGATESLAIFALAFFGVSFGAPEIARNNKITIFIFDVFPKLESICSDQRYLVVFSGISVVLFIIAKNLFNFLALSLNYTFSEKLSKYISIEIIRRFIHENYYWHLSEANKNIPEKMFLRVYLFGFLSFMLNFYNYSISALIIITILCLTEFKLTVLVFLFFGIISLLTYMTIRRRLDQAGQQVSALIVAEQKTLKAITQGIREIKSFQKEDVFLDLFKYYSQKQLKYHVYLNITPNIPSWLLEIAGFGSILLALLFLIRINSEMDKIIASISILLLSAWRILPIISRAISCTVSIRTQRRQALVSLDLLDELYKTTTARPSAQIGPGIENFQEGRTGKHDGEFRIIIVKIFYNTGPFGILVYLIKEEMSSSPFYKTGGQFQKVVPGKPHIIKAGIEYPARFITVLLFNPLQEESRFPGSPGAADANQAGFPVYLFADAPDEMKGCSGYSLPG